MLTNLINFLDYILNQSRKTIMSKLLTGLIGWNLSTLLALKNGVRTVGGSKRSNHNPVQHLHYYLIIFIGTKMARTVFMGIDVSKETLDISINNKHQRIENAERAISEFIKSKMANVFVKLCVNRRL